MSQIQQVEKGRASVTAGVESRAHETGSNIHGRPMTTESFSWMWSLSRTRFISRTCVNADSAISIHLLNKHLANMRLFTRLLLWRLMTVLAFLLAVAALRASPVSTTAASAGTTKRPPRPPPLHPRLRHLHIDRSNVASCARYHISFSKIPISKWDRI